MGERSISRLGVTVAALALAACFERGGGKNKSEPAPAPSKPVAVVDAALAPVAAPDAEASIRVRLAAEPVHLNPFLAGEATVNRIALGDIYEGLLCEGRLTEPPVPCLAKEVRVAQDGRRWEFRLRPGVRWHDGKPLTAADVVFTLRLLRNKDVITWLRGDLGDVTGARADGRTIVVEFAAARPGRRAAFARLPILPAHVFAGAGTAIATAAANKRPIGTGPLQFEAWKPGASLTLRRFAGYWGEPAAARRIVYRFIGNRARALSALAAGELDVVDELPIDEAITFQQRHRELALFSYPRQAYLAAVHNLRRPVLAKPAVRRALALLLDRDGIAARIFRGHADVISGPYPPGSPGSDQRVRPLRFDRKAAKAALAGSAVATETITLLVPTESRTMRRIADIWVEDAKPLLRLKVELQPFARVLSRARAGEFDVALLAFTSAPDLDLYTRLHSSQAGRENYGAVRDARLDALIEKARATPEPAARVPLQHAIHQRIHALQPYTFIASDRRLGLARRGIGGIVPGAYGPRGRSLRRSR